MIKPKRSITLSRPAFIEDSQLSDLSPANFVGLCSASVGTRFNIPSSSIHFNDRFDAQAHIGREKILVAMSPCLGNARPFVVGRRRARLAEIKQTFQDCIEQICLRCWQSQADVRPNLNLDVGSSDFRVRGLRSGRRLVRPSAMWVSLLNASRPIIESRLGAVLLFTKRGHGESAVLKVLQPLPPEDEFG